MGSSDEEFMENKVKKMTKKRSGTKSGETKRNKRLKTVKEGSKMGKELTRKERKDQAQEALIDVKTASKKEVEDIDKIADILTEVAEANLWREERIGDEDIPPWFLKKTDKEDLRTSILRGLRGRPLLKPLYHDAIADFKKIVTKDNSCSLVTDSDVAVSIMALRAKRKIAGLFPTVDTFARYLFKLYNFRAPTGLQMKQAGDMMIFAILIEEFGSKVGKGITGIEEGILQMEKW